jgi:hypothetical protein
LVFHSAGEFTSGILLSRSSREAVLSRPASLGTANKGWRQLLVAREIYLSLLASGWEITLRRFKPSSAASEKPMPEGGTVGDFFAELREKADLKPKTLEGVWTGVWTVSAYWPGRFIRWTTAMKRGPRLPSGSQPAQTQ